MLLLFAMIRHFLVNSVINLHIFIYTGKNSYTLTYKLSYLSSYNNNADRNIKKKTSCGAKKIAVAYYIKRNNWIN